MNNYVFVRTFCRSSGVEYISRRDPGEITDDDESSDPEHQHQRSSSKKKKRKHKHKHKKDRSDGKSERSEKYVYLIQLHAIPKFFFFFFFHENIIVLN